MKPTYLTRNTFAFLCVGPALLAWSSANAFYLNDGNMDALTIGTPPDNDAYAGAWGFPANYVAVGPPGANGVIESDPGQFHIAATNSFETGATGNSLRLDITDTVANVHLPNILTQSIPAAVGQIVRVKFDIWVDAGTTGGGSVYVGSDNGGGGFSNATDRGPQLSWLPSGDLVWTMVGAVSTIIVPGYTRATWNTVILDVNLNTATYDMYYGPRGGPYPQVGTGLTFRAATPPTSIDRFTFVSFGLTTLESHSAIDNVSAEVVVQPTSTTLAPGIIISGTPADMYTSNDMYYTLRPGVVISSSQSPIVMAMSGNAPNNMPGSMRLVYESRAQQANIRQTLEAFNFVTMAYVQLDQRVLPTTTPDTVVSANIAGPASFVGPGNEVRTKVSYKAVGPVLSYPWRVFIDESTVRFQP